MRQVADVSARALKGRRVGIHKRVKRHRHRSNLDGVVFRDLARAHHPDRHVGSATAAQSASAELFKRISAAYEALRDGDSRRAYQRAVLAGRAD